MILNYRNPNTPDTDYMIDDWQEEPTRGNCHKCGGEVFMYEDCAADGAKLYCPDCINDMFAELDVELKAKLLGLDYIEGAY